MQGVQKQRRGCQETIVQQGASPGSSSSDIHNNLWVLPKELKLPSRLKMVTSGWVQDSWSTIQSEVPHPAGFTPNFVFKKNKNKKQLFQEPSGSSGLLSMNYLFLLGLVIRLSLLQTTTFRFIWPHCASGTQGCVWQHFQLIFRPYYSIKIDP